MIEAGEEAYMSPSGRERKANFGQAADGAKRAGLDWSGGNGVRT